jgi:hypothetical protein
MPTIETEHLAPLLRETDLAAERRGELKGLEWAGSDDCTLTKLRARIAGLKKGAL